MIYFQIFIKKYLSKNYNLQLYEIFLIYVNVFFEKKLDFFIKIHPRRFFVQLGCGIIIS